MSKQSRYGSQDRLSSDTNQESSISTMNKKKLSHFSESSIDNSDTVEAETNQTTSLISNRCADYANTEENIVEGEGDVEEEEASSASVWVETNWNKKPTCLLLCFLMFLICLSDMLYLTPSITLTMAKVCENIKTENEQTGKYECDHTEVQTIVSDIQSATLIISGLVTTLVSLKWGNVSDRIGRAKVLGFMGLIKTISNLLRTVAILPQVEYSKWFIIITGSLQSFAGGTFAFMAVANCYVSDITRSEDRTVSLSMVMGTMHATMGIGPTLGSILIYLTGGNELLPLYISIVLVFLFSVLSSTVLPETRKGEDMTNSRKKHQKEKEERAQSKATIYSETSYGLERFRRLFKYYLFGFFSIYAPMKRLWLKPTRSGSLIPRYTVLMVLAIDILLMSSTVALGPSMILFNTFMYKWTSVELGYFVSFAGLSRAVILSGISPKFIDFLKKRYKTHSKAIDKVDIVTMRVAMIFVVAGLSIIVSKNDRYIYMILCISLSSFGAICSPTVQSSVIKYCSDGDTGAYFGGMALLRSFVMLVMPALHLKIYGSSVGYKPDLVFYVPLVSAIIGSFLTLLLRYHDERSLSNASASEEEEGSEDEEVEQHDV
ncbi:uncharacterized protein NDAI_0A00970 [Naumovozyma dairenensis CBS 421]|uniref:Major facilitator superfamily (MFS) profile domain-containing protein n=1 Tax=Naumovozyma dairenensis (strain ATCC 10597 / BCRC 20456 / CBS 421 / NBRC 0211 / NRRL Y-12639) TaxID=1071378 RepID=G0W367_NAUDC|nr:hypothetical protein NDAI_0A00970 [Naumovozyma dairenensis CBS 421]CCD22255.1 hypothetical protein NDAI_0A00970 [Naumovozyma dairenensis CBS 421]